MHSIARALPALLLTLFPPSILPAQTACLAPTGSVPPCMVGIWSGSNDMVERMDAIFATLPDDVVAQMVPTSGQYLFLRVLPDGNFATSPTEAQADMAFLTENGADEVMIAVQTYGMSGYFAAGPGDALAYCKWSSGPDTMVIESTVEGETTQQVTPLPAFGTSSVPFRYECAGNSMNIFMDLPPPMGTITYAMTKVNESALPADVVDILMGD